jgi:hypothetical protein
MAKDLTPAQFSTAVLQRLGIRPTSANVRAMVGWAKAEGGHWNNSARYNPLNTTQPERGAGNTGSQGNIKVYRNWNQGVQATVETLKNGHYGAILHALRGNNPLAVANAIGQTPWGTNGSLVRQTIASTSGVRPSATSLGSGGGGSGSTTASVGALGAQSAAQGSTGTLALLQALTAPQTQAPPITAPPAPANAAGPTMPAGYQAPQSMSSPAPPKPDVNALLAAVQTQGQAPGVPGNPAAASVTTGGSSGNARALTRAKGTTNFEGHKVAAWIAPVLSYARKQGWKGQVNSGFRSLAEQTRIYNSGVRPAARPGTSNHEGAQFPRGAVDVSDAQQLSDIIKRSRYSHLLQWAGAKDPVHFSHPHNGSY